MGTKGGKPLTTVEKRQLKAVKVKEEAKKAAKEERRRELRQFKAVDESLLSRVMDEIKNGTYTTTFGLAQKLNVKISLVKRALRELANRGAVNIVVKSRRITVVTPAPSKR